MVNEEQRGKLVDLLKNLGDEDADIVLGISQKLSKIEADNAARVADRSAKDAEVNGIVNKLSSRLTATQQEHGITFKNLSDNTVGLIGGLKESIMKLEGNLEKKVSLSDKFIKRRFFNNGFETSKEFPDINFIAGNGISITARDNPENQRADMFITNIVPPVVPAVPGGINTDVQYNNNGVFGGDNNFKYVANSGTVNASASFDVGLGTNVSLISFGDTTGQLASISAADGTALFDLGKISLGNTLGSKAYINSDGSVSFGSVFSVNAITGLTSVLGSFQSLGTQNLFGSIQNAGSYYVNSGSTQIIDPFGNLYYENFGDELTDSGNNLYISSDATQGLVVPGFGTVIDTVANASFSNLAANEISTPNNVLDDGASNASISGNLQLNGEFIDGTSNPGTSGQVLSSTGTATQWIPSTSFSQGLSYYGSIYSKSSWANITDFTLNGSSVAASASGGHISLSGGAGDFINSLDINGYTTVPKWSMSSTFVVGTVNGTSYGIGLGIRSAEVTSGQLYSVTGRIDLSTGGTRGNVIIDAGTMPSLTQVALSTSALSFTAGDTILLTVSRNDNVVTVTANNQTTKSATVSASYQYSLIYNQTIFLPNTGKFSLYALGGGQTITSINVTSTSVKNADVALVGDSKTVGFYSGNYKNSFSSLMQNSYSTVTLAGGSDTTADVIHRVPEIIALAPKSVILNIGRNDIANGISSAVYEANYSSIVTSLVNAGIIVYHLLPLYETVVSQTTLTTYITATYAAATIIDSLGVNYSGTASNVLVGDNLHPNAFFHNLIYQSILTAFKIVNPPFSSFQTNVLQSLLSVDQGNLGINNASPTNLLDVGTFNTSAANIKTGSAYLQPYALNNFFIGENTYYNGANFVNVSTGASGLFYFAGAEGQFRFAPSQSPGTVTALNTAVLKTNADGTFAVGTGMPSTAGYTNATFIVNSSGNVGIGTTSPATKLQINSQSIVGTANPLALSLGGTYGTSALGKNLKLKFFDPATTTDNYGFGISASLFEITSGTGADFAFFNDSATTPIELFRIKSSGNVGIGTTSPSQALHVVGSSRVTGARYDSSNSAGTSGQVLSSTGTGTAWSAAPLIVGNARMTGLTAAQALATYTVGATDTTFQVSANVNMTAVTIASFQVTCTYTDETTTSRTLVLNFSQISGTLVQTLTAALGVGAYEGVPLHIRAKAGTTIIIASTAGGTYTSVTYNFEERIMQL